MDLDEAASHIEALLFTHDKALSVSELAERLGLTEAEVTDAVQRLKRHHQRRSIGALRVAEAGKGWILEIDSRWSDRLGEAGQAQIPQRLLTTAALIAYHQPMAQSELVRLIGQKAYDHVRDLATAGLIDRRKNGASRRLTTTVRFAEHFGCPHSSPKDVRAWFRDKAGALGLDTPSSASVNEPPANS